MLVIAHACVSVPRVQSGFLCVLLASPRMLFCTNQSSCSPRSAGQPTRALLYQSSRALSAWNLLVLACSSVPSAVELLVWCWSAHACSSVPRIVDVLLASPRMLTAPRAVELFSAWCLLAHACPTDRVQLGFLRVVLASPHMFSCTECSRAVCSEVLASARVLICSQCSRAVYSVVLGSLGVLFYAELFFLRGAGQPTRALLYLVQSSCYPRGVGQPMQLSYFLCRMLVSLRTLLLYGVQSSCFSSCGTGQLTHALLYLVQSSCCLRVAPFSPRVLFCTECSRAVVSV